MFKGGKRVKNKDKEMDELESAIELLLTAENAAREYVQAKSLKMSMWVWLS